MLSYKKYLSVLFVGVSLCMTIVGSISYTVDPANIYHDSIELRNSPSAYIAKLTNSKYGLIRPDNSWGEREIKRSFARQGGADCAIIGSSHLMQISSHRKNRSLTNVCKSLMNLGVFGGTLEDYIALSYELINSRQRPKTIVFGIYPWSLDFKRDPRWSSYSDSYDNMVEYLTKSYIQIFIDNIYVKWKLLINLINLEYFLLSIEGLGVQEVPIPNAPELVASFREAPLFDLSEGLEETVTLPDGSHVYSRKYLLKNTPPRIAIGGSNYKIKQGTQISEDAVSLFSKLIKSLNDIGIDTVLIMTPYHHNVWKDESSINTIALVEVESRVKKLGKDLGIRVLGSYNPKNIGCNPNEFFDDMHARVSCLAKIVN